MHHLATSSPPSSPSTFSSSSFSSSSFSSDPHSHSKTYTHPNSHHSRRSVSSFDSHNQHSDDDDHHIPNNASSTSLNAPSLQQVLLNQGRGQYTLDNFASFLQAQFCYENLGFWLASRQYQLCAQSLHLSIQQSIPSFNLNTNTAHYLNESQANQFRELQRKMRAILETFVLPSSPHELNLSDAIRCRLLRVVAEGNYHPQVLDQARESIMDLMKCSSYPMFLDTIASRRASSSNGSTQSTSSDSHQDSASWRRKAKHHLKLVSKMLKRTA
ncbi:hypothetical protein BGZ94_003517 [Podila epigama]|nr:hypothetical protein BGZ94_003517 [Podila epigama]